MKLKKAKVFGKYTFYYLPNDNYIGQRIEVEKYEPYETQLILRQTKKGNIVIDVGANIGYYTVLLADRIGKTGKIYAFEPDKANFKILKKNVEANNLKNVEIINVAVGSKAGKIKLHKSKENLGDHKLYGNGKEVKEVKIIKLDDFLKGKKIDLMKIDTQGWEPEVVVGSKELIKKNKPTIFLEYSPASYKTAKLDGKKMMNFLRKIYSKIWWIDEWLYIYRKLGQEEIDKICANNKTGYADLWIKEKNNLGDRIGQIRDLKIKKLIKKIIRL